LSYCSFERRVVSDSGQAFIVFYLR
jgi:hypothetical protein